MHQRRVVALAQARIGHHRQRFVVDLDKLHGVFGGGPVLGHHRADRLAAEPHLVDREPVLDRFAAGEAVGHAAERIDLPQQLLAGQHFDHAGQFPRLAGVDRAQPGVGMLAAQEGHVIHARQLDIVQETAVALDQRDGLVRQHRRARRPSS